MRLLSMHPILHARNFQSSLSFYSDLGFKIYHHSDKVAELQFEACSFMLQDRPDEQTSSLTMHVMVGDLFAWWQHVHDLDLDGRYPIPPIERPVLESWGQVVFYIRDPSDIFWQFAEAGRCRKALQSPDEENGGLANLRLVKTA